MSEWKRVKLRDLLEEYCEKNIDQQYKVVAVGKYGIRRREDIYTKELSKDISKNKIIMKDTLTIGMGSNQIDIGILIDDCKFCVSPAYTTYKIKNCNSEFLKYYMEYLNLKLSDLFMIVSARQGKSVDKDGLLKYEVMLPPIGEQEKIVEILKTIDSIIEKYKSLLEEKNQFIKSLFVEMFGDIKNDNFKCVPIKKLVDTNISKVKKKYTSDDIIKYIDISSIDNVKNEIIGYTKYNIGNEPSRAQQCLIKGDILISTVRPNLKNIAVNNFNDDNVVGSSGFCVLRPKSCKADYLLEVLKSEKFTNDMVAVTTGSNYPAIHSTDILNYEISVPPMELQNKFADIVKQIDKQKFLLEKQKQNYENLRKGLMQKLLTGKVRVKI